MYWGMTLRKKIILTFLISYVFFVGFMYLYLFHIHTIELPNSLIGTSVDPETFLSQDELILVNEYSAIRNFLFFVEVPLEWFFYLLLLLFGVGKMFEKWAKITTKRMLFQSAIVTFCLVTTSTVFFYPLRFVRFQLAKSYGISTQSHYDWMRDLLISFWLDWLLLFVGVTVMYWLIRKSNRWWIYAWGLSIPFAVFMMFIQPVVIDPLYNEFYPIQNKQLEEKILAIAETAGIPAEHVYEVNMSEKTNALNAYVTGVGSNARIVLYDTTLERLSEEEIIFIMAHEMAHYIEKHIYLGIAGYLLFLLATLFFVAKLINRLVARFGKLLQIPSVSSFASLPLILLLISILTFAASPVTNAVSRHLEMRADKYAIEVTEDPHAAVSTFQELTRAGLSQVNPPLLVKLFRYGHPTIKERILFVESYQKD